MVFITRPCMYGILLYWICHLVKLDSFSFIFRTLKSSLFSIAKTSLHSFSVCITAGSEVMEFKGVTFNYSHHASAPDVWLVCQQGLPYLLTLTCDNFIMEFTGRRLAYSTPCLWIFPCCGTCQSQGSTAGQLLVCTARSATNRQPLGGRDSTWDTWGGAVNELPWSAGNGDVKKASTALFCWDV